MRSSEKSLPRKGLEVTGAPKSKIMCWKLHDHPLPPLPPPHPPTGISHCWPHHGHQREPTEQHRGRVVLCHWGRTKTSRWVATLSYRLPTSMRLTRREIGRRYWCKRIGSDNALSISFTTFICLIRTGCEFGYGLRNREIGTRWYTTRV